MSPPRAESRRECALCEVLALGIPTTPSFFSAAMCPSSRFLCSRTTRGAILSFVDSIRVPGEIVGQVSRRRRPTVCASMFFNIEDIAMIRCTRFARTHRRKSARTLRKAKTQPGSIPTKSAHGFRESNMPVTTGNAADPVPEKLK